MSCIIQYFSRYEISINILVKICIYWRQLLSLYGKKKDELFSKEIIRQILPKKKKKL